MKVFRPYIHKLLLLLALSSSCQNNKSNEKYTDQNKNSSNKTDSKKVTMSIEKFEYKPTISCPVGYPINVYRGGFELADGTFEHLDLGIHYGPWGATGASMSSGLKTVPLKINLIWVSFAEDVFYRINTEIDSKLIIEKFKEGYPNSSLFFGRKIKENETYDYIVAGFAPGGVVVIWLAGSGKQIEIGRYQAEKTTVSPEDIAKLDNHERLIFQEDYRKNIMLNPKIVPLEIQQANKNKPIPFGLWDTYRELYSWRPKFKFNDGGKIISTYMMMLNGEFEEQFDENLVENAFKKRAIPKKLNLIWNDSNGKSFASEIIFDEKEIFDAFKEINKEKKAEELELEFIPNKTNTFLTITLEGNGKKVPVNKNTKVKVFESRKKY